MMPLWQVLLLSLLPGIGNFAGGMAAEFFSASPRLLNLALHAASGIVIAIVAVELIPEALPALGGWWIAVAFAAGGTSYVGIESLLQRLQRGSEGGSSERVGIWMIYVAVAVDLASDGLMLGAGSAVSPSMAIVLAAGQVLADVPEGYATVANFRDKDVARPRRIWLATSFFIYVIGGALLSYFLLRDASEGLKMAALVFVAGLLTVAAAEEMLQEAHDALKDNRRSVLAFIGGFALFTLVSAGLETAVGGSGSSEQSSEQASGG